MSLSERSVSRPVATISSVLVLILLGAACIGRIGLDIFPKVELPYVTVVTVWPGANAREIESEIARDIEDALSSLDGLKHMNSSCMENVCQTLLEFELNVDADQAATDVREKLDLIAEDLPPDAEKPKVLKFDPNAKPVVQLAFTGDLPPDDLYDWADQKLKDRLSVLEGVANVDLLGGEEREVVVSVRREDLAARGLTILDVTKALREGNVKIPSGHVRDRGTETTVTFAGDFSTPEALLDLEIRTEGEARCYLRDVADVAFGTKEKRSAALLDGRPCVVLKIIKKGDANAVAVVRRVRKAFEELRREVPGGTRLLWITDDGGFTEAMVADAWFNIGLGVALTAAILILFLNNARAALIAAITMPVTLVATMAPVYFFGYTMNISTLMALGVSVGILVANSIVVLESIDRVRSEIKDPGRAASEGTSRVANAIAASVLTNVVVFVPIGMMTSLVGRYFTPFAMTAVAATVVSLIVSFTLTPTLASLLLRGEKKPSRLARLTERTYGRIEGAYASFLRRLSRRAGAVLAVSAVAIIVLGLFAASGVGTSFLPDFDRGEILVRLEYPPYYDLGRTTSEVKKVIGRLGDLPGLEHSLAVVGKAEGVIGQSSEGVYLAQILLKFKPKTERDENLDDLIGAVTTRLEDYTDCLVTASPRTIVGGQSYDIELDFRGEDLAVLDEAGKAAVRRFQKLASLESVDSTVRAGRPEIHVEPRRPVLSDAGVPPAVLGTALRGNLEGLKTTTLREENRSYDIRVRYLQREGTRQVAEFRFPARDGLAADLTSLARVERKLVPILIMRSDKLRTVRIFANLSGLKPLGTAVEEINSIIEAEALLPPGVSHRFVGITELMQEAGRDFRFAGILAALLTFLLLAGILESFITPLAIMLTLPLGGVGMLLGLLAAHESLSIYAMLGGVMLIGLVVNGAILIIDRIKVLRDQGVSAKDAVIEGSATRFRPVIMTTVAAILSMLPLTVGRGLGSEPRVAMGAAMIGGLLVSSLLTLFVIPLLYLVFARRAEARNRGPDPHHTPER